MQKDKTVLLSGSKGLIGSALAQRLESEGWRVFRLIRHSSARRSGSCRLWNYESEIFEIGPEPITAVVHLAGENIAGRWSAEKKRKIYDSRVRGTRFLIKKLLALSPVPETFVSASAIGYYGDRNDEKLLEHSPPGEGFLAQVCRDWEGACVITENLAMRTVQARFGVVLSARGGALARMLPAFRLGLGGSIGDGHQYISWISLHDAVEAIVHILNRRQLVGPVNVVSPNPCENIELTRALADLLRRPAFMRIPGFVVARLGGQFARETLLASTRVLPGRLAESNFHFRFPGLEEALTQALRE